MKITPTMYGKPAKCVACRQKFFLPEEQEFPPCISVVYLQEHPELLRKTGVFNRDVAVCSDHSVLDEARDDSDANFAGADDDPDLLDASSDSDALLGNKGADEEITPPFHNSSNPSSAQAKDQSLIEERQPVVKAALPFERNDMLRRLCTYQHLLDNLEHRALLEEDDGLSSSVVNAYSRALDEAHEQFQRQLRTKQEEIEVRLISNEKSIQDNIVSLHVKEISVRDYFNAVFRLRAARERLVHFAYHLKAWQHVNDPFVAGGLMDLELDAFDKEEFTAIHFEEPDLTKETPVPLLYIKDLYDALNTRSGIEARMKEWKRMPAGQSDAADAAQGTYEDYAAAHKRVEASISFYRSRMEVFVSDVAQDMSSLQKYRQDLLGKTGNGALPQHLDRVVLSDLETMERFLLHMKAQINKSLHANSTLDAPHEDLSLADVLDAGRHRMGQRFTASFYLLGVLLLLGGMLVFLQQEPCTLYCLVLMCPILTALFQLPLVLIKAARLRRTAALWFFFGHLLVFLTSVFVLFQTTALLSSPVFGTSIDSLGATTLLSFFAVGIGLSLIVFSDISLRVFSRAILVFVCALCISLLVYMGYTGIRASTFNGGMRLAPDTQQETVVSVAEEKPRFLEDKEDTDDLDEVPAPNLITQLPPELNGAETEITDVAERLADNASLYTFNLIGVFQAGNSSADFRVSLLAPDGNQDTFNVQLGSTILGDWKAVEYNPASKKLTISNGERMLLLTAGDKVFIDDQMSEEPTNGNTRQE